MSLVPSSRLGPYEILAAIGAGGMGEVYRARDTKLNRDVAIKVLSPAFAQDAERMARFQREAQTLAALNHPNIAQIYGMEGAALVMELVPGEDLRGPIPVDEALAIARQIADALEAAHEKGIVHRDLKPANIKVTPDGVVKVLDFGLARALEGTSADISNSPTMSIAATRAGMILGTAAYMAPEQAAGKAVDRRADIWSFGVVMWEVLTGSRLFDGETVSHTLADVLRAQIDFGKLPAETPENLRALLRRCLDRNPKTRLRDIGEVRIALSSSSMSGPQAAPAFPAASSPAAGRLPWIALTAAIFLIAGWFLWMSFQPSAVPPRVARLGIGLPAGDTLGGSWWQPAGVAFSPDGSKIAYVATHGGITQLYLRAMEEATARPIPGTEGASTPFFSPDGQWLGMIADSKLMKVSLAGGPPVAVAEVGGESEIGACWAPNDTIYFAADPPRGLMKVSAAGGTAQPVTKLDTNNRETDHRFPELLPGGKALLFTVRNADQPSFDEAGIAVLSLQTGERRILVKSGTHPHYASTGHLVFLRAGTLLAVPFDLNKLEVKGTPVPVVENIVENPRVGAGQFDISKDGALAYIPGGVSFGEHELVLVDHAGAARSLTAKKRAYEDFTISPDGRFLATTIEGPVTDTWIHDIARDTDKRFTFGVEHRDPAWTPDGKWLTYSGYKDGKYGVFRKAVDGSGPEELLVARGNPMFAWFWSPDGATLVFAELTPDHGGDFSMLRLDGDRQPRPLLQTRFDEDWVSFSPDGRWIAYSTNESGRYEVYVASFPDPGSKVRISTEGGGHPLWAPNGSELYYRESPSTTMRALAHHVKVMAVPIQTKPELKAGQPHLLFSGPYFDSGHDWAITPDGKGFILIKESPSEAGPRELQVILNWFEELKRRVPAGGK